MTATQTPARTAFTGFLLLACLLLSNFADAQRSPFSITLTGGVSFPVGKFAQKDFRPINAAPNENGAARPGLNTNLQIDARLSSKFFITLTGGISKYNRDTDKAAEMYRLLYGQSDLKVRSQRWEVVKLLAGPSVRLPLGNKLSFRSGIAAGIANASMPSYKITHYDQAGNQTMTTDYDYDVDLSTTFAYKANAGFGYKIGQQLSLVFDVSYFGARASGTQEIIPITVGPGPTPSPTIYLQHKFPLSNVSALIGLEWQF
jgi:hypothetical protein